ncbi:hypothetical protein BU24DRAFT_410985 [Aaosphaeria arxii CBS 175.79]|uniref:Uncharacterized protein n=1 Tax=Aaosphaeria arxii CBS 175.79 TaxID=1450172 RepID=A0A6A5XK75_9PLEO|nr:uncharacterized protein BU24DRAFT_410985 [Aaosphaeria arxii CBS 175.79]KAF2013217.1 hypothetical protein BU24DRAFT_410985 [Aaosphaeria arxii CBS 175.79]
MNLPTVTAADLRDFHSKHFPLAPVPELFNGGYETQPEAIEEYYDEEEDDGLGYYDDGVKRTLTDEQIALFRHTEIQTILRERRRKLESEASSQSENITQGPHSPEAGEVVTSSPSSPKPELPAGTPNQATPDSSEPQQAQRKWTQTSAKSKERQKRKNKKRKLAVQQRKKDDRKRIRESTATSNRADDESSDEWDPRRQATGPDVQNAVSIELDY